MHPARCRGTFQPQRQRGGVTRVHALMWSKGPVHGCMHSHEGVGMRFPTSPPLHIAVGYPDGFFLKIKRRFAGDLN